MPAQVTSTPLTQPKVQQPASTTGLAVSTGDVSPAAEATNGKLQAPLVSEAKVVLPLVVNWHLEPRCNYCCKFCFATFEDIPGAEVVRDAVALLPVSPAGAVVALLTNSTTAVNCC
jgi:hypothetical protein